MRSPRAALIVADEMDARLPIDARAGLIGVSAVAILRGRLIGRRAVRHRVTARR